MPNESRQSLHEKFIAYTASKYTGEVFPIYVNPSQKELREVSGDTRYCRGLVSQSGDLYVFPTALLHHNAKPAVVMEVGYEPYVHVVVTLARDKSIKWISLSDAGNEDRVTKAVQRYSDITWLNASGTVFAGPPLPESVVRRIDTALQRLCQ